jgi:anti-sigma factor RsiW
MSDPTYDDGHDFLSAYLDGELTTGERGEIDARLAGSESLRAELDEVRAARDAVRGLGLRDAPDGFWDAVTARVDSDNVVSLASRRRRVPLGWIAGAAAVAAALIAVIVLPGRASVRPNPTAVAAQHGAASSDVGDSISTLATVGPLVRRR